MLDARGGRDDRYGLYGIYKTSKKTEEMSREESVQHFLDLIKKSRRGKFKVYIGMIAGVGKSYRMLQEAHELLDNGVDVPRGRLRRPPHPNALRRGQSTLCPHDARAREGGAPAGRRW